ncbi:hypothetical protein [Providencia hangzhouensis]|uniref:hypothetical protein n=1 Tax=Providencia hangzhouensis TaxID=3031799 RepID=UPI0034DCFB46
MFDFLREQSEDKQLTNNKCFNFSSERLWRLTKSKYKECQDDQGKGVIYGVITPNAFDLRPRDSSVSLNQLITELCESKDEHRNRLVMNKKIANSLSKSMASIFIGKNNKKLLEDPRTISLLNLIEIVKTPNGEFNHNGIDACHYDLFYLSKDGSRLSLDSDEFKESDILDVKSLLAEIASIPCFSEDKIPFESNELGAT